MIKKQKAFILWLMEIGERVVDSVLPVVIQHSHQVLNSSNSVQYRWSEHPQASELIAGFVSMQSWIKGFQVSCFVFCMEDSQTISMDDFDPDDYFCLGARWWRRSLLFWRFVDVQPPIYITATFSCAPLLCGRKFAGVLGKVLLLLQSRTAGKLQEVFCHFQQTASLT